MRLTLLLGGPAAAPHQPDDRTLHLLDRAVRLRHPMPFLPGLPPRTATLALGAWLALGACGAPAPVAAPTQPLDWVREVTRDSLAGVVQVRTSAGSAGSGFVVHEGGWVVTNSHVVAGSPDGVVLFAGPPGVVPYTLVADGPSRDLALLRLAWDGPLPTLPLGRSEPLELGARVVVIGAPQQMFPVVTSGILSGRLRPGFPGAGTPPEQLLISAATLRGSSGSAVLDDRGRVVGVMAAKPQQEPVLLRPGQDEAQRAFDDSYRRWAQQPEAFGLVVPVDDVHRHLPAWLAPQHTSGLETGFELDPSSSPPRVVAVVPGSRAAAAGLQVDDVLQTLDGARVENALDVAVGLHELAGKELRLTVERSGVERSLAFERAAWQAPDTGELRPGVTWRRFDGVHDKLPVLAGRTPGGDGRSESITLPDACRGRDAFALQLDGLVEVPSAGTWRFALSSDDGSQLLVHDRLVVDNDGLHADRQVEGSIELEAGLHPLRVLFFEKGGDETLRAFMGKGEGSLEPIAPERLWSRSANASDS